MKILCLIIDSDGPWTETYAVHRRLWNTVLDKTPFVEGYFLRSDPTLTSDHTVSGRVFTVRGAERYDTILAKSLKAIEVLLGDHDYVMRTNLSSMYDFVLLQAMHLARENVYAGSLYEHFVSGSGMILSRDIAKKLIKPLHPTVAATLSPCDDVAIWQILSWHGIRPTVLARYDYDYARGDEQITIGQCIQYRLRDLRDPERVTERDVAERLFSRLYADDRVAAAFGTKRLALVTCLYDLVKRGITSHRTPTGLLDESTFVLQQERELIVFTEPELEEEVLRRREGRPTIVVTTPFEELLAPERRAGAERGSFQTNALLPRKNQPYVQLTWSKFAMLEKAVALTTASHLGWIDIGITHVAHLPPGDVDIFADPSDAPRIHVLRCFSKYDVNTVDYWRVVWGHAAAGLIVGNRDQMQRLVSDFWTAVDRAISMGLVPFEEALLSFVVAQRAETFSYSYGDYEDILRNHDTVRGGEKHISWIVSDARSRGLPETMGTTASRSRQFVHDPINGTMEISGFPAVILDRQLDTTGHLPGRYRRDLIDWALQMASTDKQFIDCGAYAGSWTLLMARHFRDVHAFEPQRLVFQRLCGNVALNGLMNVHTHCMALDAQAGVLALQYPLDGNLAATGREDLLVHLHPKRQLTTEMVASHSLDEFESTLANVGLVKLDVNGMELRVLKGALAVLRNNELPKILCECWNVAWYREDKQQLVSFLHEVGYRVVVINGYPNILLAEKT